MDAELDDLYLDAAGKLWRCIAVCPEPTVTFEEVEGHTQLSMPSMAQQAANQYTGAQAYSPPIIKNRQTGGVRGAMWNGWKRIYRPTEKPE